MCRARVGSAEPALKGERTRVRCRTIATATSQLLSSRRSSGDFRHAGEPAKTARGCRLTRSYPLTRRRGSSCSQSKGVLLSCNKIGPETGAQDRGFTRPRVWSKSRRTSDANATQGPPMTDSAQTKKPCLLLRLALMSVMQVRRCFPNLESECPSFENRNECRRTLPLIVINYRERVEPGRPRWHRFSVAKPHLFSPALPVLAAFAPEL